MLRSCFLVLAVASCAVAQLTGFPNAVGCPDPMPASNTPLPSPLPDSIRAALGRAEAAATAAFAKSGAVGMTAAVVYDQTVIWSKGFGACLN